MLYRPKPVPEPLMQNPTISKLSSTRINQTTTGANGAVGSGTLNGSSTASHSFGPPHQADTSHSHQAPANQSHVVQDAAAIACALENPEACEACQ